MRTLVLYYSYGGNTRGIAEMIQSVTGGDMAEIETVKPYTGDYNAVVAQGKQEVDSGFMPELKPLDVDLSAYDTIVLGTPVWWCTFAPAMRTFIHKSDLSGKIIYPFATNGGWIGHTLKDFEKECVGADVKKGINIKFSSSSLRTPEEEIRAWAKAIQQEQGWGQE